MNCSQAFQAFRSCRGSLAAHNIVRSSAPAVRRRIAGGARFYSDDRAQPTEGSDGPEAKSEAKSEEDASQTPEVAELQGKLKQKEAEVTDLTSRLRYLQADFLNLQRNAAREKEQTKDFAITRFATDLLETVDVLSLALKSVPESALSKESSPSSSDSSNTPTEKPADAYLRELHTGVEITQRQLLQTLFKYGVKPFDPTGDQFDPNRHEALYQAPIPDKEPGTVFDCQKTGYMIKDRVLRAAQVGVVQDRP
ncbi:GrpE-domain-containing protein [Wolfiporia cocos MD-104 SS10]|uniref:GrpE protein homolog, mitochondrial n=1 Tax=Wolfiporia cocos (strain MD-104) TaxID=742152 RepID=A0A2H3JJN4_WOLCO|nr:GrpE-domain-containing protein [Wolfiporia cocos MD-104 SS10]